MKQRRLLRGITSGIVLALGLYVGSRRVGSLPPLGRFLDPTRGFWTVASGAELPDSAAAVIPGLAGQVRVFYDERSVPHIFAESESDAARALGYVVARDRLFQLEIQTRATAGTLTELVGSVALRADRSTRRLGLAWSAERNFAELDSAAQVRRMLEAFAEGVNVRIDALEPEDLPLEYHLLGTEPTPWLPQHSFYLLKRMGWTLAYRNLERQRRRARALVGSEAADALFPVNSPIQEPVQANGHAAPRFDYAVLPPPGEPDPVAAREMQLFNLAFGEITSHRNEWTVGSMLRTALPPYRPTSQWGEEVVVGSNNWAVMPLKTEGRHAILAGDPHLNLTLPSIWYEAHLLVPGELDAYGVTIPGFPGITIGFNRNVAWSFTNSGADVMDFYTETLDDPVQPERYLLDNDWRPLAKRVEEYRDRSGTVIAVDTVYHTHRGPVLMENGDALSLRWTVLEKQGEMSAFSGIAKANTVDEWLAAMESYVAPAQNGIVADRNGSIAIRASGWFPIQPGDGRGDKIRDGSQSANDWQGYWPVGKYPFSLDPGQGYLASANQQPIDPRVDGTYLGADWPSPWRAMQINRLLREGSHLTPADLQRFQTDPGSARADLFVAEFIGAAERLLAAGRGDTLLEDAARLLQEWDRRYTRDNTRAILFELAMNELTWRTWDELREPQNAPAPPQRQVQYPASQVLASLLPDSSSAWWDDRRTPRVVEDRDAILGLSLQNGLMIARQRYGDEDEGGWRWDRVRHANIYHLLGLPSLSALELPIQGGPSTINPSSGNGTHGASWRMVVELGPQVRGWSIYPGGQSGNPVSLRYDDRIEEWMNGALDEVLFPASSDQLPPERVMSTLLLSPEN